MENIYTGTDPVFVKELLDRYQVEYIFVGSQERQEYPEINEALLRELGEVVYQGTGAEAYVIQVRN